MRWLYRFSLYDFEIVYRKDCNNQKADGFSRQPVYEDEDEYNIPEEEKVIHLLSLACSSWVSDENNLQIQVKLLPGFEPPHICDGKDLIPRCVTTNTRAMPTTIPPLQDGWPNQAKCSCY